ncbi:DUF228 domain-containing protein (plasmid) [Borrelia miyamotoi]|uniref:DUF228 domain-containing protein n=3 Tax=Borrelia miyamotoi TaxID=47466 RepID=A0AAQ3HFE0_9SPIR|nr:DUF228 domain-containing protein [Borrelia miyamotoi]ATQ17901.1 DUF228 domain-containing protein [Borrelia miyamotoi]ATQ20379.1 DUF228 domain-containing protein [Borrelia miyamotoi]ATQ21600.3 DUF228 domain-containing protein [Borrelia miyamotoi]WAZ71325.1 DUF228 domain-containing protein [Borrelia miyamotoi]WCB91212.1 DUF228 domain-containing protein [Borrelia miyamotoi]
MKNFNQLADYPIKGLMKNPSSYRATFSNNTDFRDKHLHFSNSGGTETSRKTQLENHPMKGYPYKRGVKLVVNPFVQGQPHFEPHVEAGGGDDLYGICIDVDDFTRTATVVPITENFKGRLLAKNTGIKSGDKLLFSKRGILKKIKKNNTHDKKNITYNAIALSNSFFDEEQKHCFVEVEVQIC